MNALSFIQKTITHAVSVEAQQKILETMGMPEPEEMAAIVQFLISKMPQTVNIKNAIDICGTGGSGLPRINTSTIAAFILAALDVTVAKHGNRAASGRYGSFDLLEDLNLPPLTDIKTIEKIAIQEKLAFLYAPYFHPVLKTFAPVRKALGRPTFFNLLGPLLNPVQPDVQLIGTTTEKNAIHLAKTCVALKKKRACIVTGNRLDEVTLTGETILYTAENGSIKRTTITPENFGIKQSHFKEISGGDAFKNTKIALDILYNRCTTRHKDLVLINAALALVLAGKTKNLKEAYRMAKNAIEDGRVQKKYEAMQKAAFATTKLGEISTHKRTEVAKRMIKMPLKKLCANLQKEQRNFTKSITQKPISLIAEIKKASPSGGQILPPKTTIENIAKIYEKSDVNAISVLCDKKYFNGSLDDLLKIKNATMKTPILCKDFIIDPYQIYEARAYGADAVLLIAAILTIEELTHCLTAAKQCNMAAICEVHTMGDLVKMLATKAKIIGINNRNLFDFTVTLATTKRLAPYIPKNRIGISESGFSTREQVFILPPNIDAILVGTGILQSQNISEKIRELKNGRRPLLKICGIRTLKDALFCDQKKVNYIGLNFVPTSKRKITVTESQKICKQMTYTKTVGVFQNQSLHTVNTIAQTINLDYIQLAGNENDAFIQKCIRPVFKTIAMKKNKSTSTTAAFPIFDGQTPGSGKAFPHSLLKNETKPFFLAGGITPKNLPHILKKIRPYGVDLASGIETHGSIDQKKITAILKIITQ